jgi:putative ABC transport system ATP-binding protein
VAVLKAVQLYRFYHVGDAEIAALRGVDVALRRGEFVALVGPSGSGKSTLLSCLTGLDEPDGGYVDVADERLSRRSEAVRSQLRARHIGLLMQSGNLFDHLTVDQNVALGAKLSKAARTGDEDDRVDRLGISARRHAFPSELSGGEAARAGLAVALAGEPEILICDEPTAEVDADTEALVLAELVAQRSAGVAVLVATHSDALARAADRILHMRDGRILDA